MNSINIITPLADCSVNGVRFLCPISQFSFLLLLHLFLPYLLQHQSLFVGGYRQSSYTFQQIFRILPNLHKDWLCNKVRLRSMSLFRLLYCNIQELHHIYRASWKYLRREYTVPIHQGIL